MEGWPGTDLEVILEKHCSWRDRHAPTARMDRVRRVSVKEFARRNHFLPLVLTEGIHRHRWRKDEREEKEPKRHANTGS